MAVWQHQQLDELHQLRTEAAQARLRSIRSQIALALTFCSIAQSEIELGHIEQAQRVVAKVQKLVATVRRHLGEPGHIPASEVESVRSDLQRLESRIRKVEERQRR